MAKQAFTAKWVESVKPPAEGRVDYNDAVTAGLVLRVTASGSKSWSVRYKVRGAGQPQQRYTIGPFPAVSLAEARTRAATIAQAAQGGIDLPAQEAAAQAAAAAQAEAAAAAQIAETKNTVQAVADDYLTQYKSRCRPNSISACSNELRYLTERFGARQIGSLTARDLKLYVEELSSTKPAMAHGVWTRAGALLNWAREREIIDVNPIAGVRRSSLETSMFLRKMTPGKRILSNSELRAMLLAIDQVGMPGSYFMRMLLLTGCRSMEVRRMPWSEWDGQNEWIIPGTRYKTKLDHLIPLSRQARDILETLRKIQPKGREFVFASNRNPTLPLATPSHTKKQVAALVGFNNFKIHDLRRTVRSGMARLGVSRDTAERVIGHVVGSTVERTYDLYEYQSEKAAALQLWADHLDRLREGDAAAIVDDAGPVDDDFEDDDEDEDED